MLEQSCRKHNFWPESEDSPGIYAKVPIKHITKYAKELKIGGNSLSLGGNPFDVTPFFPLLAFPRRDDKEF